MLVFVQLESHSFVRKLRVSRVAICFFVFKTAMMLRVHTLAVGFQESSLDLSSFCSITSYHRYSTGL